jgi:hypothetical protein
MYDQTDTASFRVCMAAALLLLGTMCVPLALGLIYIHNDLGFYTLPWRAFLASNIAGGERTSWCPWLFGGFYALGEGSGIAHPGIRALYAWLPLGVAFDLEVIGPYASILTGLPFLLVRWGLRRDAAIVGGILFAFGGPNFVHHIHPTLMVGYAHLPWLLLAADVALRSPSPRRVLLARTTLSLLTASQVLCAHVQAVWISGLAELAFVWLLARQELSARERLRGLLISKGLGYLAGGAQLVPQWEAFRDSVKARPSATYSAMASLPPWNMLQWVAPYLYASGVAMPPMAVDGGVMGSVAKRSDWRVHEYTFYMGAAVPVLMTWLFASGRKRLSRRELTLFRLAVWIGLGALVLSFGDFTALFRLTMRLPVVGHFRVPGRYLALFQLAVAILSAMAYGILAESRARRHAERLSWCQLWPLALAPGAAILVAAASRVPGIPWPPYLRGEFLAPAAGAMAGPVLLISAAVLVAVAARGSQWALLALPIFLAVDLGTYGARAVMVSPPMSLTAYLEGHPVPAGSTGSRVTFDRMDAVSHDAYLIKGLRVIEGYASLPPRRRLSYKRPASLRVAGVEWALPHDETGHPWRYVEGALPRVRLVSRTKPSRDAEHDLDTIDVASTALVSRPIDPLPDSPPGKAHLAIDRPGAMDVVAEAPTIQLLVVAESYHTGWRAKIDGESRPLIRVNGDFLGCLVPPGKHRVTLRFRPNSQTAGLALSALALFLIAAVPLAERARSRGSVAPPHFGRSSHRFLAQRLAVFNVVQRLRRPLD